MFTISLMNLQNYSLMFSTQFKSFHFSYFILSLLTCYCWNITYTTSHFKKIFFSSECPGHRLGHSLGKNKVAQNKKRKKTHGFSYSKNMANFEVKHKLLISEEWNIISFFIGAFSLGKYFYESEWHQIYFRTASEDHQMSSDVLKYFK